MTTADVATSSLHMSTHVMDIGARRLADRMTMVCEFLSLSMSPLCASHVFTFLPHLHDQLAGSRRSAASRQHTGGFVCGAVGEVSPMTQCRR